MGKGFLENRWVRQVAVALGYALAYSVIRPLSTTYWPFAYGLRIACLLLVPQRYWLALAIGELVPLTYFNAECLNDFGLTWVVLCSIPPISLGMPVAWWFCSKAKLFPAHDLVDVKLLWCCTLALSALWACANYAILMTVHLSTGPYTIPPGTASMYLLDNYMTMLSVVPWVVMIRIRSRKESWRMPPLRAWTISPLTRDTLIAVLALTLLAFLYRIADGAMKPIIMMSMFLPATWVTFKHGWEASVLCGTLSLMGACLLTEWKPDPGIQQTQFLMAIAITSLYIFGARISAQWRQHEQVIRGARETQDVAQSALVFGERRLQQTSQALECVAGILHMDYAHMLERFVPGPEQNEYGQQAMALQQQVHRLAENIYPSAWRERGLAAALNETIGQALQQADITYFCETPARELRFLSPALQAAIYRVACEVVARFSASPACAGVHLAVRMGRRDKVRWVVLRIRSVENETRVARAALYALERYRVAPKLGASMKSFDELQRLTRVFDGTLRRHTMTDGTRVSALLCDEVAQTTQQTMGAAPIRLWVG